MIKTLNFGVSRHFENTSIVNQRIEIPECEKRGRGGKNAGDCNYATMFIKNCLQELKERHTTICFTTKQFEAIKKKYPNATATFNDGYYEVEI